MKTKILTLAFVTFFLLSFVGCNFTPDNQPNKNHHKYPTGTEPYIPAETANPSPTGARYSDLEFIFNNQTLGTTTIAIKRSEWQQLLNNYDYFYKNENCVHVETYTYEKDGIIWTVPNAGFRLRGNTSRFRPQGKDSPTDKAGNRKPNADWSADYYNYAKTCPDDDYRQSHFKVDFEEWLEDPDEFKMSNCMKGVALKRMDGSCTREIFCYDLFHKYGIWTAPRASHTRVFINFIENIKSDGTLIEDINDCKVTKIDFGIYEMFEEVNKQSLKARDEDNNKDDTYKNYWKNNKGNLWKCAGGDLTSPHGFGVEDNRITKFDSNGNPTAYVWNQPTYDLKTNKDKLNSAEEEFRGFITELNELPKTVSTEDDIKSIKAFYEKWFDVEFFLKTYAINILVGMDDDYWGNANNYYLYFDTGKGGTGKVYFIPFDYDNTLGNSITDPGFLQNPLEWGRGRNRPLMDRILLVPEYRKMFKKLLQEVSAEDSHWNFSEGDTLFLHWKTMVKPYLNTPDLKGWPNIATLSWDDSSWRNSGYNLTSAGWGNKGNIYDATREYFMKWTNELDSYTFNLNGGNINGNTNDIIIDSPGLYESFTTLLIDKIPKKTGYIFAGWTKTKDGKDNKTRTSEKYNTVYARWIPESEVANKPYIYEINDSEYRGIKIGILNIPEEAAVRDIFIDGMNRANAGFSNDNGIITVDSQVTNSVWGYPYTKANTSYKIQVEFKNTSWQSIAKTNEITIMAERGEGEFYVSNTPKYTIKNGVIKFNPAPQIKIGNRQGTTTDNWSEYYLMEIQTVDKNGWWHYESWNYLGAKCNDIDFKGKKSSNEYYVRPENQSNDIMFCLRYIVSLNEYGSYRLQIYDYNETKFNFKK